MLKYYVTFILFFLQTFASETDFERESQKIVNAYIKELKKSEKINVIGSGGGSRGEINLISIDWDSNRIVNLKESRRLIVSIAEELFRRYNQNKKIRPYLHNFPFNVTNVDLHISFDKNINDPLQIAYVSLGNDIKGNARISYYGYKDNKIDYCKLHSESYEEALMEYHSQFNSHDAKILK